MLRGDRMIKNNAFLLIIILLLGGNITISEAYEVVALKSSDIIPYNEAVEGFRKTCDCTVREVTVPEGHSDDLIRTISNMNPEGVLAVGLDALNRVKAIKDRSIVYALVHNPRDVVRGKNNISGVNMAFPPLIQLSTIHEIFPQARRVGIIYDPVNTGSFVKEAMRAASEIGVRLVLKTAQMPRDVPRLLDSMQGEIDVFWMLPDITVVNPEAVKYMLLFSFRNKVPVFSFSKKYVEMGAVAAMNIVPYDIGAQAGDIMRTVRGAKVSGSPMRFDARKTDLVINRKVARKMDLSIIDEILARSEDAGH
jgi:putative ABC transport system substrate-binding protein